MANLQTTYAGLTLKNPVIAGASGLTSNMDSIKKIEDSGAGAMVIKSLFEEQIQLDTYHFDREQHEYDDLHAEMITIFPELKHAGPEEHLEWVRKAKETADIPVIGSLNAVNHEIWLNWAKKMEQTGVDALELNFFHSPAELGLPGTQKEKEQVEIIRDVTAAVKIPVTVKLSPFYSSLGHIVKQMDAAGAAGFVLFNRLFEPDLDPESLTHQFPFNFSTPVDNRLSLRYTGLLYGDINASLCGSTGIYGAGDLAKMLLAGSDAVQVVSCLYKNGIDEIRKLITGLETWMDQKGFAAIRDLQGKMSRKNSSDPWVYRRAQYIRLLMKSDPLG